MFFFGDKAGGVQSDQPLSVHACRAADVTFDRPSTGQ
ncbi:hypothetical protein RRG08_031182 [Elysia crispata]|uniref:Uncharacterized protein n=1 Tax=Elysia crispata TaxID=231223 RepID=A0AAE0ZFE9_9GAST|nr:hypothetical protein RRG08_031182 [Elysia crispata]